MEGEQKKFRSIESPERQYGANVEIHAIFMRHGERAETGELTEKGREEVDAFGQSLAAKDAIKAYTSPIQRAVETAEQVIESAPHDKKLKTRIRTELGIPSFSQEFLDKLQEIESERPDSATEFYLGFGKKRPDPETASPYEVAEMMAYLLMRYFKMPEKLKSGSRIDLINVTHQGIPEALLKEVLVQQEKDEPRKVVFETLAEIGGPLKPAEPMEFMIKTDKQGERSIQLRFRNQTFDIDTNRLRELAESYAQKQQSKK